MKNINIRKLLLYITLGIFLSGCAATTPMMEDRFDADAKSFKTAKNKANIYVVREDAFAGSALLFQVLLDGKVRGAIAPGTYLLFDVKPGPHTVAVITQENAESAKISASAGKNYFVEVTPTMGWMAARVSVKNIEQEKGHKLVIKGKRAKPLISD